MKILIVLLLLSISPIELRIHTEDLYELENLINDNYDRPKHRQNKPYIPDKFDDDQYEPSPPMKEKTNLSHKKVLDENEYLNLESDTDDGTDQLIPSTTTEESDAYDESSSCINKYDVKLEQLVKVKELKNGAHMIRFVLIDKRTLSPNLNVKDSCMLACCSEKTCDLAMLSEQPTHDGYKCYLFACNGSCPLATHQYYSVIIPKQDSRYYAKSETTKTDGLLTSTRADVDLSSKKSFFRETSVILFLVFGVICTTILFILLCHYCRSSQKRGRKSKNYAVDEDYLINGLYL